MVCGDVLVIFSVNVSLIQLVLVGLKCLLNTFYGMYW